MRFARLLATVLIAACLGMPDASRARSDQPGGSQRSANDPVADALAQHRAVAQNRNPSLAVSDFVERGEIEFKAGRYEAAIRAWRHALVDDPENGALVMLLAQSLFALGRYEDAAGATQAAMQMLPQEKWGTVIANYSDLYGSVQAYTEQLKTLEQARLKDPDNPALRFLLGFHFGNLGYPKHAVQELDKGLNLAPHDLGAIKVRKLFAAQWPEAPPLPEAAAKAEAEFENAVPGTDSGGSEPPAQPAPASDVPPGVPS